MANSSIYAAFERMWLHIAAKLGAKADVVHSHDDLYYTETEIDTALGNKVDKESGKTLTSNDFTDSYKEKLDTIVGENVTGETFSIEGESIVANEYAEIFNNYAENKATGKYSHAEGYQTIAKGSYSHVEGYGTFASGAASHAEGYSTKATARYSHAEGASTTASGNNSHAEGNNTTSSGHYSHAEGNFTTSSGGYSHAEGNYTTASETFAHAEGSNTVASGTGAHAEGNYAISSGTFAHAEGYYTIASSPYQHVRGEFNISDVNDVYSTIVGNGTGDANRSNAFTLDWDGNGWFNGDVYVGSTSGTNKDDGSQKLATEAYIDEAIASLVNSAPETLDTLGELATAFQENEEVVSTLNSAITNKVDKTDVISLARIDEICGITTVNGEEVSY